MIGWTGSALVLAGRVLLAYEQYQIGFLRGAFGDICWIYWGTKRRVWSLVALDLCLLFADILGVAKLV